MVFRMGFQGAPDDPGSLLSFTLSQKVISSLTSSSDAAPSPAACAVSRPRASAANAPDG